MSDPAKPPVPAPAGNPQPQVSGASVAWKKPQLLGMQEAARELAAIGPDNPSMPETYFKDFLVRLFNPQTGLFDTALWYHVVGEWRKGLNVTDPSGQVLFVTPPIISTVVTRVGQRRNAETGKAAPTIAQVADYAALQGRRHPMLEARTMNEGLAQYHPEVEGGLADAWANILARYGLAKSANSGKSGQDFDDPLSDEGELL
jgi:hypothetical protein